MTVTNATVTYPDSVSPSRRRLFVWAGGAVGALVVAALFWIGIQAAQAQHAMSHASDRLRTLQKDLLDGDSTTVNADVTAINKETSRARAKSNGWLFRVASNVPYLGQTPRSARSLAQAADDLANGPLRSVLGVTAALSPNSVRGTDGSVDLTALTSAADQLRTIEQQLDGVQHRLLHSSHGALVLDPMDRARADTIRILGRLHDQVAVAARFSGVGPAMLGDSSTRRYLVVVQNNNQARGTGGVADAYATVDVRLGQAKVTKAAPTSTLSNARDWASVNTGLDFPTAAAGWRSLFAKATRTKPVDGVIGVDPVAFEHMLVATGPVSFKGRVVATAPTVVAESEVRYATFKRTRLRTVALSGIAKAVLGSVFAGKGKSSVLASQLGKAADEAHLHLWSAHPKEQAVLAQTSFAGALPTAPSPFAAVVVNNTSGARLDYFLQRSVTYFAEPCQGSTRRSTIVVRLQNVAPDHPAPFLAQNTDHPSAHTPAAQLRFAVRVYTTVGSKLDTATLDGQPLKMTQHDEHGHPVFDAEIAINRFSTRTLSVQLIEPRAAGVVVVPVQPLARPQATTVNATTCHAS